MHLSAKHATSVPLLKAAFQLACAAGAVFLGTGPAWAQNYALEGGSIGIEQVERGKAEYLANCAGCHGEDLHAEISTAPDLTGSVFKYGWVNHTVGEKYDVISTLMPSGMGGSLSDQAYTDIVAYILAFNGVEATQDGELPANSAALQDIKIVVP